MLSHVVIFHGRRTCHARKPACGACPVARWCPSYGTGETDPEKAAKLLKFELAPSAAGASEAASSEAASSVAPSPVASPTVPAADGASRG